MDPGTIGRYRIVGPLDGATGARTLMVHDEALGRDVVLRGLWAGDAPPDAQARAEALIEMQAAVAIIHPTLARIHDVIHHDGRDWVAREYVEGDNLAAVLARPTSADPRLALQLAHDIATAVEHCHAAGITHGGLEADKVIVTAAGRAVIVDLGVASAQHKARGAAAAGDHREHQRQADLEALRTLLSRLLARAAASRTALELLPAFAVDDRLELVDELDALATELQTGEPINATELVARLGLPLLHLRRPHGAGPPDRGPGRWLPLKPTGVTLMAVLALLVAALAAVMTSHRRQRPSPLYVAVPAPAVSQDADDPLTDHVRATVHMAVVNTLAALDQVQVLHPRELDPGITEPQLLLAATAADEVVVASVSINGGDCRVRLRRLAGPEGHTAWVVSFASPAHNLLLLADTTSAYLRQGFGERDVRDRLVPVAARAQDYASFLEARHTVVSRSSRVDWIALLDQLEAVRQGSPDLVDAYVLEASVARYLFQASHQESFLDRARQVLAAARQVRPDDPRAILAQVDLALAAGDEDRAAAALATLARVAPLHPNLATYRALLAEKRGQAERAIAMLSDAAASRPSCWRLAVLADMEMRHGLFRAARSHLEAAHNRAPASITILERRARLELLHGDAARAEELYLDLVASSPQPQYLANLGTAQMLLGRYHDALEHYHDAEAGGLQHPMVTFNLAECHALLGDHHQARTLYRQALESIRRAEERAVDKKLLGYAAVCLVQLGHHREAIETSARAEAAAPQSPEVAFTRSLVEVIIGDTDAAQASMTRAMELGLSRDWFRLPWFTSARLGEEPATQ